MQRKLQTFRTPVQGFDMSRAHLQCEPRRTHFYPLSTNQNTCAFWGWGTWAIIPKSSGWARARQEKFDMQQQTKIRFVARAVNDSFVLWRPFCLPFVARWEWRDSTMFQESSVRTRRIKLFRSKLSVCCSWLRMGTSSWTRIPSGATSSSEPGFQVRRAWL